MALSAGRCGSKCVEYSLLSKTMLYNEPFNVYYELIKDSITKQKEGGKNSVKNIRKDQESKER